MKKFLAIFLLLFMLVSVSAVVYAQETTIALDITCDDEHLVVVPSGSEITVTYALINKTDGAPFKVRSIYNDIFYDKDFFELVEGSITKVNSQNGIHREYSENIGLKFVSFNGFHLPTLKTYQSPTVIGTFKLRVKATSGQSVISSTSQYITYASEKFYELDPENLTVIIGEEPETLYDVVYMNNGQEYSSSKASGEISILPAPSPAPSGYEFEGWEYDGQLYQYNETFEVKEDVTFVAKWKEIVQIVNYTLTFDTNGGTALSAVTKEEGTVIDLSSYNTTKSGFEFVGWYSDEALNNKVESITLNANTTVYAKWEEVIPDYTLTFNTNGGSTIAAVTKPKGTVIDLSDYNPTRSGYSFEGWYTTSSFNVKVETVKLESDTTVYAKWKKNDGGGGGGGGGDEETFTLTFRTVDGKELDKVKYDANTTVDLSKIVFEKEGFVFEGWYTEKELTNKVTTIKLTKNTVLYAKYTEKADEEDKDDDKQDTNYHPAMLTTEHYAYIVGREGGLICPKDNITRAEVATIFFRLLTEQVRNENLVRTNAFDDVNEGDWFNTAVSTLAKLGIINGRTANTFAPNANITRAEFTTMAARFSDVVYEGEDLFKDIAGHWANGYINAAASIGWVIGDNGLFRPDDNITRAEVMTLVNRMLNREPESEDDLLEDMTRWEDNADENAWYYLAVQEAINSHGYQIKDDGKHEKWTLLKENPDWTALEK